MAGDKAANLRFSPHRSASRRGRFFCGRRAEFPRHGPLRGGDPLSTRVTGARHRRPGQACGDHGAWAWKAGVIVLASSGDEFAATDVQALLEGDPAAARAFERRFGRLLRMKIRMRNGRASAPYLDDVVQETLARVLTALRDRRVDDLDRLGAFVSRTGDFVLSESQRSRARFRPLDDADEPPVVDVLDGDERLVLQERVRLADHLMALLPDRDREILRAIFFDELDKDEVCRRFEIDRDHLRVLICRAKERLRGLVARYQGKPGDAPGRALDGAWAGTYSQSTKDRG
jgi:RNA polymerase sigma-70 factor, ECF subfamily